MPAIFQPVLTRLHLGSIEEIAWRGIYWGKVLSATLDFLIVAFIVFLLVRAVNRTTERIKESAEKVAETAQKVIKK